jgi:RNA polymerase sigma factor for flagellar operon FliA
MDTTARQELLDEYCQNRHDVGLRNTLVEAYRPIVVYQAERLARRVSDSVDVDDLISAGVFGLIDALKAFDPKRGVKLETYCVPRVYGAMLDELRNRDWVPRLVRSKASRIAHASRAVELQLGRAPTLDELAGELGVAPHTAERMLRETNAVGVISLSKKWFETDAHKDVRQGDLVEDRRAEDPVRPAQRRDLLKLVCRGLNKNERLIVVGYYYEQMTMKQIGAMLGLSESRVSQMHSAIVARLQKSLAQRREEFAA